MFDILTGVRQGRILSHFVFLIIIDFIMRKATHGQDYGIQLGPGKLADLDFADDITLLSNTAEWSCCVSARAGSLIATELAFD